MSYTLTSHSQATYGPIEGVYSGANSTIDLSSQVQNTLPLAFLAIEVSTTGAPPTNSRHYLRLTVMGLIGEFIFEEFEPWSELYSANMPEENELS